MTIDTIVALCKRRGFVFPGSEIYGGLSNSWDYGPAGVELKNNIKQLWWKTFVHGRTDIVGIDAALMMNPKVWEASGHVENFTDPLVECKSCHSRFRQDQLTTENCPHCGKNNWDRPKQFNLMFKTFIGPVEDSTNTVYLRPETAQAMFVDFPVVQNITAKAPPFGIAQIGKAFRNEITPGNFIFRTREFEQMEIEYFFKEPKEEREWQEKFEEWRQEMHKWFELTGIDKTKVHEADIPDGERSHYSKRTIDFEFEFPFGQKELYGLAYRTNYDLKKHEEFSGKSTKYKDPQTGEEYTPHVIEPTWGVDRTVLAVLCSSYMEEEKNGQKRVVLKFKPYLAPYKVAVFPLVRNKPEITGKAQEVFRNLKKNFSVVWDDRGNIGKRYFAQDEIGTPWCITVDYTTLEDNTVTVRDRDTTEQERVPVEKLNEYFAGKLMI